MKLSYYNFKVSSIARYIRVSTQLLLCKKTTLTDMYYFDAVISKFR